MKTLKNLLIAFLLFLLLHIFFYLCRGFVNADFNFANWSSKERELLIFLSSVGSIALSFIPRSK
jgi:hypothetical protein